VTTDSAVVPHRLDRVPSGVVTGAAAIGVVTLVAEVAGHLAPAIGAPAAALVIGILVRLRYTPDTGARQVMGFASRSVLQAAIVVLGATFSLGRIVSVGRSSLPLMLTTLALALVAAWVIGPRLRVAPRLQALVGVGTAICGASAIGAVSGVIAATEAEIAYAISTIFVFNVVAVVVFPLLGHLLGLGQQTFGLWAGTAINDTSSVVAAAYGYGTAAGGVAVVTKLARVTMIVPVVLVLAALRVRRRGAARPPVHKLLPLFLVWFILAAALNTAGLVGSGLAHDLARAATVLITIALAAIGLSTRFDQLRQTGVRPFLLGAALWAVVGVSGLAFQTIL
jgi:uncharacterized integral membrane protein (TIGR00698 family)